MNHASVRTVVVLSAILSVACAIAAPGVSGARSARIIGGDKVAEGDFHARYSGVVSVQFDVSTLSRAARAHVGDIQTHTCGGTLISPRLVVTAAHCVAPIGLQFGTQRYEVLAGNSLLSTKRTAAGRVPVTDVFVHPKFNPLSGSNAYGYGYFGAIGQPSEFDVAVLRLAQPITNVAPIALVGSGEDAVWGNGYGRSTGVVALGWGETQAPFYSERHRESGAHPMRSVAQVIRADRRCERSDQGLGRDAADFDPATMLCAGTADGPAKGNAARTPCFGDSGGPLLAPAADGSLRLVGLTSWTSSTHPCASWAVYTRIAGVRDWIRSIPEDANGPGNLTAPTNVAATATDVDELHVTWTPSTSGSIAQYRVHRQAIVGFPFFGRSTTSPPALALAAVTGGDGTGVDVYGVEPQRVGEHETRAIRVDVEDAAGNRASGNVVRVAAPVDAKAPGRPARPHVLHQRRARPGSIVWTDARDNDCVGSYRIDVRPAGRHHAWRTNSSVRQYGCDPLTFGYFAGFGVGTLDGLQPLRRSVGNLTGLSAGDYLVRIVTIDRAGNASAPSRVISVHLDKHIRRSRTSSRECAQVGFGIYCQAVSVIVR